MQLDPSQLLQRLKPLFQENFEKVGELGAAVSVWQNGKAIVDLYGGFREARRENPWTSDTLVLVWSATKGIGSACVLHALQEHKITLDQRVSDFWPEFAQAGKEKITLAQLLSHQAGLCALDRRVDVLEYDAVIRALEAQKPLWPPGTGHDVRGKNPESFRGRTEKPPVRLGLLCGSRDARHARPQDIYLALRIECD